ncbi:DUF1223 domain-containing protein [Pseudohalocynthiibacter aestuariivivens]|jgi:hypothetical protein|uniref:DUF1223 domain-containing protein n=1 Tax=Pseudohalocynthiibacter aestuariivivens TaxID=1591409 RepID=A0ABV5JCF3_9RHOB|nr:MULTISPECIES: DUF1223 domain-containing protein [Pseudohalocynthiibacter]MBS9718581.1 DUF1223 domain-containing protein [Pseudohalocynthiibacter aestuariivivens]MCK0103595.1 DUF1223 domain-containing protein [Pseudohalocynthiibacter sp. F2068]
MRKQLFSAIIGLWVAVAGGTQAQSDPVVLELYTSQGCSSCPPADALLTSLADREDVIALALHVDYWDYIGWVDSFGDPAYTARQKAYARAANKRMVYTPQMIVGGKDHIVGHEPEEVAATLQRHASQTNNPGVSLERRGQSLNVTLEPSGQVLGPLVVQLVRYTPSSTVNIRRGENAGRSITYSNIVTSWENIRNWDGRRALSFPVPALGSDPVVVIVQKANHGAIVASARLR